MAGRHRSGKGCLLQIALGFLALIALVGATAESCADKKANAHKPGGALPRVVTVAMTGSSTVAGFHWKITVEGPNFRPRSGTEKTLDMPAQRIEVVEGKDIRVTFTVWTSKPGAVLNCRITVKLGLQKDTDTGAGRASCAQNVPNLFDAREYG